MNLPRCRLTVLLLLPLFGSLSAAAPDASVSDDVLAGHSYHGEAFNEGPRQAATLMPGMSPIEFATSTESKRAQRFFEQGIAQLHGFWYLEAERSFRQAAHEDPDMAIAYWGMAMANVNNDERARGFIDEAMKRRGDHASAREKLYVQAVDRFLPKFQDDSDAKDDAKDGVKLDDSGDDRDKDAKKEAKIKRTQKLLSDIEGILHEYPDDVEAKAWLVVQMWLADRAGVKLTSRYAVNALLGEIFAANPMHPAHHYRIHLWDSPRPENALKSAAACGPASPGIAHMWHMPGHIYSKLKRYKDAAWQQEASARVDHAHMRRARLMPDQIHNFAHNNEWLVRNLIYVGRVNDALQLSRNLISLPRHPKYNSMKERGSYKYGRQRLLQALTEYGLWDELITEADGPYWPTDDQGIQRDDWQGWLAVACFMTGDTEQGRELLLGLKRSRHDLQGELLDPRETTDDEAGMKADRQEKQKRIRDLKPIISRISAAAAAVRGDAEACKKRIGTAKLNGLIRAQWIAKAGDMNGAIKAAKKSVKDGPFQVRPLAVLADLLWRDGQESAAIEKFELLQTVAAVADLETPLLACLDPVAKAAGVNGDWRLPGAAAGDLGERPPLDDLGTFRWRPYPAPAWTTSAADGETVGSASFDGRPRLVIFYLGFGCLHCMEQLHEFSPHLDKFQDAGIDVIAISTESVEDLQNGLKNFDKEMNIPLTSDGDHTAFHAYGCWDDFEDQPLHGTFLIDGAGNVRWQDIGYKPFTDVDFVLEESKRLLGMPM